MRLKSWAAYALHDRMTRSPQILLPLALSLSLALAACGRQEPVSDLPSSEELANAANAAAAEALQNVSRDETVAEENRNYVNNARGFSITLPEGWVRDASASNGDGVVSEDAGAGADIRVFWSKNDGDKDLQQIVEGMTQGSEAVDGDFVGNNEYRGTANDGEGNSVAVRLVRKPDGSLITATFVFPEMLSEQYLAIGQKTLDSLRVFGMPAAAEPATAANASGA
jgi:predicted small lipoprotein YifL